MLRDMFQERSANRFPEFGRHSIADHSTKRRLEDIAPFGDELVAWRERLKQRRFARGNGSMLRWMTDLAAHSHGNFAFESDFGASPTHQDALVAAGSCARYTRHPPS
jgi:hypothetical protein